MSRQAFDKKIAELEALRSASDSGAVAGQLRKALKDRNNYLVSKAAPIAAQMRLVELIPDLLAAFDRFMIDPVKTDPQCWAKNAIVKALKDLEHRGAQVYLRGIAHVQLEPVWGGRADSAATLRGACALALADTQLDDLEILTHLTDTLADPEMPVRIDGATAIAQVGRPEGALLLRLKLLLGDSEPEVLGQCFAALVSLEPRQAVAFICRFLKSPDEDVRLEAATSLALSKEPEAIEALKEFWRGRLTPQIRRAVLLNLGASTLHEAAEFLMTVIAAESGEIAATAIEALGASRFRAEMRDRIAAAIADKDDPSLKRIYDEKFGGKERA